MRSEDLELVIGVDGVVRSIYDDLLADLFEGEVLGVRRASHVEPALGGWAADLSPVGGPVLGPFRTRREALAAEVAWLRLAMAEGRI